MKDKNLLYEKFAKFEWLLKRKQMVDIQNGNLRFDTTRGQGRILATLELKDGISTKNLSYILGVRIPSINEMLSKLEKAELIERRPSEQDKRILLVYLTDKGHEEIADRDKTDETDFFDCLTIEEQQTLEGYLDRMISNAEQVLGEQSEEFSEQMKRMEEEREKIFEETGMLEGDFMRRRGPAPRPEGPAPRPPRGPVPGPEGPAPRPPRGPVPGPEGPAPRPPRGPVPRARGPIPEPKGHMPERMPRAEYFDLEYDEFMPFGEEW